MKISPGDLRVIAEKIYYRGLMVGTINDLDMTKERFEFEDFLKFVEKKGFSDERS